MGNISKTRVFRDTGKMHEREDLTYTLFKDFNQANTKKIISFFRSDFRGSKFINCIFYKNNFDRADFISSYFEDCTFNKVDIAACEIKNCYFKNVIFTKNIYNNTSIQECIFDHCVFQDQHMLVNMKNCKIVHSKINNCTFERSTTEHCEFTTTTILNSDLATMHAENHIFVSCEVKNTKIGLSYLWGYLFYDTSISDMEILYRGNEVLLDEGKVFGKYVSSFIEEGRYFEFINACVMYKKHASLTKLINDSFQELEQNSMVSRKLEIRNILDALSFYIQYNMLPYVCVRDILEFLELYDWSKYSLEERLIYKPLADKINLIIENGNFNEEFINSSLGYKSVVTFHCQVEQYETALHNVSNFLNQIFSELGIPNSFQLVEAKKGSWWLSFIIPSAVALSIIATYAHHQHKSVEVNITNKIASHLEQKLSQDNISNQELQQLTETAVTAGIIKGTRNSSQLPAIVDLLKVILK